MRKKTPLDRLIKSVRKNIESNHVIIVPNNISKKFIKNVITPEKIKNINIFYMDEYIFNINEKNINALKNNDLIYLENVLEETNSIFNNYNLTNEAQNILNIINELFLEKNIIIFRDNFSESDIIEMLDQNLVSYESKIFLEIVKLWINKSLEEDSFINSYMKILNKEFTFFSNCRHYIINTSDYAELEINWANKYLPNINAFNVRVKNDQIEQESLKSFQSRDFSSQEEELDYTANDIIEISKQGKYKRIAIINNNRYFTRRLSAILEGHGIKINDNSGWLLSTSSCSSYVNNILNFYIKNYNYINLHDIVMSPYFMPSVNYDIKKKFLNNILEIQKKNINAKILIKEKDINDIEIHNLLKYFKTEKNISNEVTFNEFKDFLISKIKNYDSHDLIINDSAGREIYKSLNYLSDINLLKNNKDTFLGWQEKMNNYLETKTFSDENKSNFYYTDIKNALLCSFDKIYINSMNSKNFPKKNINNFSKNNIIYSELALNSSIEQIENIASFLYLSNNSENISLTFSSSDGDEYLSKSKFKNYIDFFIKDKNSIISKNFKSKKINNTIIENNFFLDDNFKILTYRDIENFNTCHYCFYSYKKSPKKNQISNISENIFIFGNFVHTVLSDLVKHSHNMDNYDNVIQKLNFYTELREKDFFLKDLSPYKVTLWKKLLPNVAEYFLLNKSKKYNFSSEKDIELIYKNTITLKGRYDLKYSFGKDTCLVDYKTSSYLPSRKSVLSGESLQLPFYTLLDKSISLVEFLSINVSRKTIIPTTYTSEELDFSRKVILDTVECIYKLLTEKLPLKVKKSSLGCDICGYTNEK